MTPDIKKAISIPYGFTLLLLYLFEDKLNITYPIIQVIRPTNKDCNIRLSILLW